MMTIKHITDAGEEFVYPTTHINFVPAGAKNCAPADDSLWGYEADGHAFEMTDGTAYVMNEDGRTVARYKINKACSEADPTPPKQPLPA